MSKEYNIIVEEKSNMNGEYRQNSSDNSPTNFSESLVYETTRAEYDHCVQRSEKLDNKIYILLTVLAFLFALLCSIISEISNFSFPSGTVQLVLIISYSVLLTIDVLIYVATLIQLIHLLKGISFERFHTPILLEKDMINADSRAVTMYICSRYIQCIDTNNRAYESRFSRFNKCVNYVIPIIIISILLVLISNFII